MNVPEKLAAAELGAGESDGWPAHSAAAENRTAPQLKSKTRRSRAVSFRSEGERRARVGGDVMPLRVYNGAPGRTRRMVTAGACVLAGSGNRIRQLHNPAGAGSRVVHPVERRSSHPPV
jgi:hypothetical protein